MTQSALAVDRVAKAWGSAVALDGVSLAVQPGELVAVVGPSGSGKSTLLRVVAGLEQPDAGRVCVGGRDVTRLAPERRGVAMVFQSFALFPHMDVAANVGFGLLARGVAPGERERRVAEVAERLGLGALLHRRPGELSGGERQRVALARGLVGRPAVLLLDEPLSNLDAQLRAEARAEIARLQAQESITMLHVTHDQGEALSLGHRLAVMRDGRLQQAGRPDEVYDRPANAFVAGFLGTPPMALLDGEVRDGAVHAGGLALALPAGAAVRPGQAVRAGVRPEHVRLGGDGAPARVELVEAAGHEQVLHLRAGGARLTARAPRDAGPPPGATVRLAIDPAGVRLFDAGTGEAL